MYIVDIQWMISPYMTEFCLRLLVTHCPSPSDLTKCQTRVLLQTCISNVFCQVGLYSFDDEWLIGCECGQEPWITNPVCSEEASGKG